MDSEIIDAVTGWDSAPAESGYRGLRSLANDDFTGAVVAGMTWGFMLNGRLLGVFDGQIEDFEDESFESYRAPDPSLPLLYAMQETGGDVRAQYYTEETPLEDADGTLSAGGFTGYVELSENVLSGDYYVVYHGGKSMSAAYVGNSKRLITGDDAFERASDEIGIYKVYDVDIELVEIPEGDDEDETVPSAGAPVTDDAEDESSGDTPASAAAESDTASESPTEPGDTTPSPDTETKSDIETPAPDEPAPSSESPSAADTSTTDTTQAATTDTESHSTASDPKPAKKKGSDDGPKTGSASTSAGAHASSAATTDSSSAKNGVSSGTEASESAAEPSGSGDDVFSAEAQWRNARSIPSLDPGKSKYETAPKRTPPQSKERSRKAKSRAAKSKQSKKRPKKRASSKSAPKSAPKSTPKQSAADAGAVKELKAKVSELESERDQLASERDSLKDERDEYRSRAEELDARVEELEAEVERFQSKLDEVGVHDTDHSMSPDEALRGTNLFVRYARKGEATLEKAHAGQAKREDVVENLRLEHHTTFDTDGLGVEGRPYEEFLEDTPEYGFATWVVTELLYEIGETGNRSSLAGVFDAIPEIDRIELYGTVSVPIGEDETEPRNFDIIFRDQMGDPLFVANMNDSRDPATKPMVAQLAKDSKAIAEANETLGSAFVVTASFFEPEALEVTAEKTGGGLLSRSKRKSYVKLSRKNGYHLCLVEGRSGDFHLNVPDI
ncbi:hypothetical protein C453_08008 [Haloferax elongans ATCC BAA-1513]|uniref:DUF7527 domain-containing protein n=1 Tax=Haloferax elongans ATCC BAA-1513 TaxID=1230453 RepID=M0HPQ4_HALEO|nr:hypothetical protein [Haloferax elongans]ELZ85743.1 hypothetical protein C453_08008 [Haloferax elongans ATCC BAA-1513]